MANESGVMDFAVDRRNVATGITGPSWPGRSRRRPAFRSRNTRIVPGHFSYARKAMQDVRSLKKREVFRVSCLLRALVRSERSHNYAAAIHNWYETKGINCCWCHYLATEHRSY